MSVVDDLRVGAEEVRRIASGVSGGVTRKNAWLALLGPSGAEPLIAWLNYEAEMREFHEKMDPRGSKAPLAVSLRIALNFLHSVYEPDGGSAPIVPTSHV